ncbi:hypothetical protein PENSPDRAFT_685638 [Peniophora sp. CONT]|nr:hypothetical protein PENSPDRAFT_685638 [Peniophora sp. CONT]
MFSLNKIATFALLALGVAASAVPAKRDDAPSAAGILNELAEQVASKAAQFATMTPETATIANIAPIASEINAMFAQASTQLATLPPGSAANDKTATIQAFANALTAFTTPAHKLVTTPGVSAVTIVPIFTQIGVTLAALLANVVTLVEEVLTVVVDLLEGLIAGLETTLAGLGIAGAIA